MVGVDFLNGAPLLECCILLNEFTTHLKASCCGLDMDSMSTGPILNIATLYFNLNRHRTADCNSNS